VELTDGTVVYLHDDYTVSRAAWPAGDVLFDGAGAGVGDGAAWAAYCRASLGFAVPDDFDLFPPSSGATVDTG
jgi:hypothetical protein